MNSLCNDNFMVIFEYLNIQDYLNLRLSCRHFRDLVNEYTLFQEMMEIMQKEKVDFRDKVNLFYKCCSQKRVDIARFIYQKAYVNIFLFRDIFESNFCDRNDIETIRATISIRGIDVSQYDELKEENYPKFLTEMEEIVRYTRTDIPQNIEEAFSHYCRGFFNDNGNLNKIKAFYLFGSFEMFNLDNALPCFRTKTSEIVKYILSVTRLSENEIDYFFQIICTNDTVERVKFFMENVQVDNKILVKGLKTSLTMKNYQISKYLLEIIKLDEKNARDIFIFSCKTDNVDIFYFLLNKVSEKDIADGFMGACQNKCNNISTIIYNLNILDEETKQNGFLICCISTNIETARMLLSTSYIDKKTIQNSFRELCLSNNVSSVAWLLNYTNIDSEIVNSTIIECCSRGNCSIVRYLTGYFKLAEDFKKECFLFCLNNNRCKLLYLFAREYDQDFIDCARQNISTSRLMEIFENECLLNELDGIRWISRIIKIKSEFINEIAVKCFEKDCYEVNKYLFSNYKISLKTLDNCFLTCCKFGYNNSIKLLMNSINNEEIINKGFVLCCTYGHFVTCDLLYRSYNIDIFYNNQEALHQSYINGHRKIYTFLKSVISNY